MSAVTVSLKINDPTYLEEGTPAENTFEIDGLILLGFPGEDSTVNGENQSVPFGALVGKYDQREAIATILSIPDVGKMILEVIAAKIVKASVGNADQLPPEVLRAVQDAIARKPDPIPTEPSNVKPFKPEDSSGPKDGESSSPPHLFHERINQIDSNLP